MQAVQWLQADLEVCKKMMGSDSAAELDLAKKKLSRLKSDPDLAAVRDADELAKLSAGDAAACRELWNDVNAALKRARPDR